MSNEQALDGLRVRRQMILDMLVAPRTADDANVMRAELQHVEAMIEYREKHGGPAVWTGSQLGLPTNVEVSDAHPAADIGKHENRELGERSQH